MASARTSTVLGLVLTTVAAVTATAATPEAGTVSKATPQVKWSGETTNGGATTIPAVALGGAPACLAPTCDTYTLTVADAGGDLKVTAKGDNGFTMLQIVRPDGTTIYNGGEETKKDTSIAIRKAPAGDYTVQIASNTALLPSPYAGIAELTFAGAAAATAGPTPTPAPAAPAPSGVTAAPAPTVELVTRSVRASAARTRLTLALRSSGPVSNVTVTVRRGSAKVATGRLAKLDGRRSLTLKLRKALKKGRYSVTYGGTSASGASVGGRARLTIR